MPDSQGKLLLSVITKAYPSEPQPVQILTGISLVVEPGHTLAIIGPSGSGKSTLLNIIGSLDKPTSGTVALGQTDVTALEGDAQADFRAKAVGFVFQEHHLLPQLTALENIMLPSIPAGGESTAVQRAKELMVQMGVSHRADAFPAQMSGGERQRTAVARALVNGAKLLLCDEPTGSLDRESGANIITLLLGLAESQGVTVITVTHNLEQAARFQQCMELIDGKLAPLGSHVTSGAAQ